MPQWVGWGGCSYFKFWSYLKFSNWSFFVYQLIESVSKLKPWSRDSIYIYLTQIYIYCHVCNDSDVKNSAAAHKWEMYACKYCTIPSGAWSGYSSNCFSMKNYSVYYNYSLQRCLSKAVSASLIMIIILKWIRDSQQHDVFSLFY